MDDLQFPAQPLRVITLLADNWEKGEAQGGCYLMIKLINKKSISVTKLSYSEKWMFKQLG